MSGFTRRDLLTAFLGSSIAAAACRRRPAHSIDGEIVGASDKFGHRLRHLGDLHAANVPVEEVDVLIAGGGIAGLTAAWRLRRAGFDRFVICELEPEAGGTSRSGRSSVSAFPWAAHYLPVPLKENRALISLLDEMQLLEGRNADGEPVGREEFLCRAPQERLFCRGSWYEGLYLSAGATEDDLRQLRDFESDVSRWVAWRDAKGRRAFIIPIALCSDDAEVTALDRMTMSEYARGRGWTSPRLLWLIDYSCRDDYGTRIGETSAWAGLFYFASRVPKPGVDSEPLLTWPEGNGRFVRHFMSQVGRYVRTGLAVADITPDSDHERIQVVAIRRDGTPGRFRAKKVIFTAPQFLAPYVIAPWRDSAPAYIRDFEYAPWLVANVHLRERPEERGFPLCWDNVMYESRSLGYVVATHQTGLDRGPTVLTYYYALAYGDPRAERESLLATDWHGWSDVILSDLQLPHPRVRELTDRIDIMRWGHAMIRPRPGFVRGESLRKAREPYRGVHFANTDLSGVALFEEAFHHGIRTAEEVLAALGVASPSMLG